MRETLKYLKFKRNSAIVNLICLLSYFQNFQMNKTNSKKNYPVALYHCIITNKILLPIQHLILASIEHYSILNRLCVHESPSAMESRHIIWSTMRQSAFYAVLVQYFTYFPKPQINNYSQPLSICSSNGASSTQYQSALPLIMWSIGAQFDWSYNHSTIYLKWKNKLECPDDWLSDPSIARDIFAYISHKSFKMKWITIAHSEREKYMTGTISPWKNLVFTMQKKNVSISSHNRRIYCQIDFVANSNQQDD